MYVCVCVGARVNVILNVIQDFTAPRKRLDSPLDHFLEVVQRLFINFKK